MFEPLKFYCTFKCFLSVVYSLYVRITTSSCRHTYKHFGSTLQIKGVTGIILKYILYYFSKKKQKKTITYIITVLMRSRNKGFNGAIWKIIPKLFSVYIHFFIAMIKFCAIFMIIFIIFAGKFIVQTLSSTHYIQ